MIYKTALNMQIGENQHKYFEILLKNIEVVDYRKYEFR